VLPRVFTDKPKKASIADEVSADDMPCAMPLAVRAGLPRGTTTEQCDGRYRRVLPIDACSNEGLLAEPVAAVQP
jgi:hypothetical protein